VAYIISSKSDELETRLFRSFGTNHLDLAGVVEHNGYRASGDVRVLGHCSNLIDIVPQGPHQPRALHRQKPARHFPAQEFCELRYSGVHRYAADFAVRRGGPVCAPRLLTSEWLLSASGEPALLYIKKVKRLFDVIASLAVLILTSPLLLAAMLASNLPRPAPSSIARSAADASGASSGSPSWHHVRRCEKAGPVWASKDDPRVTSVGRLLRRYRIDEIPQVINVLMARCPSWDRPERPEIIEKLATRSHITRNV